MHALELADAVERRHARDFVIMKAVDCRGCLACAGDLAIEDHLRDTARVGQHERTERSHQIGL